MIFYFEAFDDGERELQAMYVDLRAEQAQHGIILAEQIWEKQCVRAGHTRLLQ